MYSLLRGVVVIFIWVGFFFFGIGFILFYFYVFSGDPLLERVIQSVIVALFFGIASHSAGVSAIMLTEYASARRTGLHYLWAEYGSVEDLLEMMADHNLLRRRV